MPLFNRRELDERARKYGFNRDTFEVAYLGPDSLALENDRGIFVYKRINSGL